MYVNELLGPEMLDLRCLLMDDLWVQRSQKSKLQKIHTVIRLRGNMFLRCSLLISSLGYVDMESNNLCASVTSILLEYRAEAYESSRRPSWYD